MKTLNDLLKQEPNQDLRQFLISYYELIAEFEDMEDVHIDLVCSNAL